MKASIQLRTTTMVAELLYVAYTHLFTSVTKAKE